LAVAKVNRAAKRVIVTWRFALCAAAAAPAPLWAQTPSTSSADSAIIARLEHKTEEAVVRRDAQFLDSVYAPSFRFKHSTGTLETRDERMASLRRSMRPDAPGRMLARVVDSLDVEVHGDIALSTGRIHVRRDGGAPEWQNYTVRFARVWVRNRAGHWQLLTHHSTGESQGPPPAGGLSTRELIAQPLSGRVFVDRNANGTLDQNEVGLARVAVSNQDTVVLTDATGAFQLPAGRGTGLVFVSAPSGYRSVGNFWRKATEALEFGLATWTSNSAFTFAHASDTHISEQSLARTRRLRALTDSLRPDFVLITGDLVRDALRVGEAEARGYYDLFAAERRLFRSPVFTVPGNHEVFGIETQRSRVEPAHPLFGRSMYRDYFGPDYYSFTRGGVHFVALNSVDIAGQWYYGHVDSTQLAWLRRDIAAIPADMPVVTFNHIPFYMTADQVNGYDDEPPAPTLITVNGKAQFRHAVANAADVLAILGSSRPVLALGGHIHFAETIERAGQNVRFATAAATVGPAGPRPSGFTLYTVRDGVIDRGRFVAISTGQ
jgi:Icc protein